VRGEFAAAVPVRGVGAQLWRLWKVRTAMKKLRIVILRFGTS
jgi:hypothetical protein